MPVGVKDVIETFDMPTGLGSPAGKEPSLVWRRPGSSPADYDKLAAAGGPRLPSYGWITSLARQWRR